MDRIIERRRVRYPAAPAHPDDSAAAGSLPPARPLPPTRAARPARSRGVFFEGGNRSRPARWVFNALCVALATLSIVASAHFAEPAFDAAVISNAGPGLVASTTQAPSFIAARRR